MGRFIGRPHFDVLLVSEPSLYILDFYFLSHCQVILHMAAKVFCFSPPFTMKLLHRKHEINDDLGTPARDHIKFRPDVKKVKESSAGDLKEDKVAPKKKVLSSRASQPPPSLESRKRTFEDSITKTDRKVPKLEKSNSSRNLPSDKKSVLTKIDGASGVEEHKYSQQFDVVRPFKAEKLEIESTKTSKSAVEQIMQQLDSDSERR